MENKGTRLDSWKQIAAYLDKSERTVRRWEQTEGLPVHKHLHQQKGSVWAFTAELDVWRDARTRVPSVPVEPAPSPPKPRLQFLPVALAAFLSLLAISLSWTKWSHPKQLWRVDTLISLPGQESGLSFAPDGANIAFVWSNPSEQRRGIYVQHLGDSAPTPFITSPGFNYNPTWSPDGRQVAFIRRLTDQGHMETWLCVADYPSGESRPLLRISSKMFVANRPYLNWSLDGQRILTPIAEGTRRGVHWVSATDGTVLNQLTHPGKEIDEATRLAPDGSGFVFLRLVGPLGKSVESLYYQPLSPDGSAVGEPRLLRRARELNAGIAWAPDGKNVIYCVDPFETGEVIGHLYRIPVNGSPIREIAPQHCSTVETSRPGPNGRSMLVFGSRSGPEARTRLWITQLESLERYAPFAPSQANDLYPQFAPDGRTIAFFSWRDGSPSLWTVRPDGTDAKALTHGIKVTGLGPKFSPTGDRLLFGALTNELGEVFVVPASGGSPTRLNLGPESPGMPDWSFDGTHVYYLSATELMRSKVNGTDRTSVGEWLRFGAEDDQHTYYLIPEGALTLARSRRGEKEFEVIARNVMSRNLAMTRRFLYFVDADDRTLWAHEKATGKLRKLGVLPSLEQNAILFGFTISPDDKTLIWASEERPSSDNDLKVVRDFQ